MAGGVVEVDGLQAGSLPLSKPLRVAAGSRVVTVVTPGYKPQSREVIVPGGASVAASFELVPLQVSLAHLAVKTRLLGVEVFVDGQLAGRGPLPASLALAPGPHTVEARRAGYKAARQSVELGPGATGEVSLEPEEESTSGGLLALKNLPEGAQIFVDDRSRPVGRAIALPPGPHRLKVEAGGFRPFERVVDVPQTGLLELPIDPEPTPEALEAHRQRVRSGRLLGWGFVAGGAAVALAGGGLLLYDANQKAIADRALGDYAFTSPPEESKCTYKGEIKRPDFCDEGIRSLLDEKDALRRRDFYATWWWGWAGRRRSRAGYCCIWEKTLTATIASRSTPPYARARPTLRLMAGPRSVGLWGTF